MDASKDSMKVKDAVAEQATFEYLMYGAVRGTLWLTPEHMVALIDKRVAQVKPQLRRLSLPRIADQVAFGNGEWRGAGDKQALKVYSSGEEAWTDVELIEYWFVDRDDNWLYISCNSQGTNVKHRVVSAQHLVRHEKEKDGTVRVSVYAHICAAYEELLGLSAENAAERVAILNRTQASIKAEGSLRVDALYGSAPVS